MDAVDRFDPSKGSFSTFAGLIIKQHILRGINRMKLLLHLSECQWKKITNLGRIRFELRGELGRKASDEEIAARMRISEAAVAELRLTKKAVKSHPSLDEPITEEGDSATLHEILPDSMSSNPFEILSRKSRLQEIDELLSQLDERERYVINAQYALDGSDRKTLEEIGKEMGVTPERICQIKGAALKKMHAELLKKKQAAGA
jgi:RNA polymerase sigma factor (sigma-70 family)